MRRTRLGQARALSGKLVFVLVALAVVGSGYLIGRYFLSSLLQRTPGTGEPVANVPVGSTGTHSDDTDTTTVSIQLSPLTMYKVQIGAYSTKENADRIADTAMQKGVGAAVMTPDPLYKVYCGMASSKSAATKLSADAEPKLRESVLGKDDKLYVGDLTVDARSFSITGPKNQVTALEDSYNKSDRAIQSLLTFWDSKAAGEATQITLSSMASDLAAVKTSLTGFTPDLSLKEAYDGALAIVSATEAAVKEANESAGGDGGKAASAMKSFIEAIDVFVEEAKSLSE